MKYDIRKRGLSCIMYKFERKRDYGKNRIYSDRTTRTAHRGRRTKDKERKLRHHLQGAVQRRGENQRTEETYRQSERQG